MLLANTFVSASKQDVVQSDYIDGILCSKDDAYMNTNEIYIWKERFAERKVNKISVKEWCLKNRFTKAQYYYWYKIVNESASVVQTA